MRAATVLPLIAFALGALFTYFTASFIGDLFHINWLSPWGVVWLFFIWLFWSGAFVKPMQQTIVIDELKRLNRRK
jgi:hypothetical protein